MKSLFFIAAVCIAMLTIPSSNEAEAGLFRRNRCYSGNCYTKWDRHPRCAKKHCKPCCPPKCAKPCCKPKHHHSDVPDAPPAPNP
jgi:hypothetical protein